MAQGENENNEGNTALISRVQHNCKIVKQRLNDLACKQEEERMRETNLPVCQPLLELIGAATNPNNLCQMDPLWMPWF